MEATASLRYLHGNRTSTFRLPVDDFNVRDTFGASAFLVDEATQQIVRLDAVGRPLVPLSGDATYSIVLGTSAKLQKHAKALQGKLEAARMELTKLSERHAKLATCVAAELAHLRSLLAGTTSADKSVATTTAMAVATAAAVAAASEQVVSDPSGGGGGGGGNVGSGVADAKGAVESSDAISASVPTSLPASRSATVHLTPGSDGAWPMRPIGHLRTIFVEKNGTPRQGCVAPSSAAALQLQLGSGLNASHSLDGVAAFSHVWLIFIFHLNGNQAAKSKVLGKALEGEH